MSYWSSFMYLFYNKTLGMFSRGAWDIPAGLGGGSASSGGVGGNYWGKFPPTGCSGTSVKTITHGIGDTNYTVIITMTTNATYAVTSKTATQIQVTTSGGFDFVFIRTI